MVHGSHDRASIDKIEFFLDFKNANLFLLNSKVHGRLTVWSHMCLSYRKVDLTAEAASCSALSEVYDFLKGHLYGSFVFFLGSYVIVGGN